MQPVALEKAFSTDDVFRSKFCDGSKSKLHNSCQEYVKGVAYKQFGYTFAEPSTSNH